MCSNITILIELPNQNQINLSSNNYNLKLNFSVFKNKMLHEYFLKVYRT